MNKIIIVTLTLLAAAPFYCYATETSNLQKQINDQVIKVAELEQTIAQQALELAAIEGTCAAGGGTITNGSCTYTKEQAKTLLTNAIAELKNKTFLSYKKFCSCESCAYGQKSENLSFYKQNYASDIDTRKARTEFFATELAEAIKKYNNAVQAADNAGVAETLNPYDSKIAAGEVVYNEVRGAMKNYFGSGAGGSTYHHELLRRNLIAPGQPIQYTTELLKQIPLTAEILLKLLGNWNLGKGWAYE